MFHRVSTGRGGRCVDASSTLIHDDRKAQPDVDRIIFLGGILEPSAYTIHRPSRRKGWPIPGVTGSAV